MSGVHRGDDATLIYGSQVDVAAMVDTSLFVLCPNNSGSTFVKNALALSSSTWNLAREGQRTFGFAGPQPRFRGRQLVWAGEERWIAEYIDDPGFDWDQTRTAWYLQTTARAAAATVFVEKSPPFLLIPNLLVDHFTAARFVIMTRDPYAMYAGIIRRSRPDSTTDSDVDDPRVLAARHVVACLRRQVENRRQWADRSVFFTYEQLCGDPRHCAELLAGLVPALDDLDFDQRVEVKGIYDEPLRNMNAEQIATLTADDLAIASSVFAAHIDVLDQFGYQVR